MIRYGLAAVLARGLGAATAQAIDLPRAEPGTLGLVPARVQTPVKYSVKVELSGFQSVEQKNIEVSPRHACRPATHSQGGQRLRDDRGRRYGAGRRRFIDDDRGHPRQRRVAAAASSAPILQPQQVLWEEGVKNAYPHWSKDGARILFQSNRGGKWHLYVMDRDGSNQVQLTRGDSNNNFPDWSPDNKSIAFVSDRGGNEDVYVMSADATGLRNVSNSAARDIHPYWSPDGLKILFNSTRDVDRLQIYEVGADGSRLRRLVSSDDDDTCARVSPEGDRILYLANLAAGRDDIMVRDRDGSNPINLTNDAPPDGWPTWTADGTRIVFSSRRAGPFALYVMRARGSDARRLTSPPDGYFDARPSVSPDQRHIVFNREKDETIGILVVELASR